MTPSAAQALRELCTTATNYLNGAVSHYALRDKITAVEALLVREVTEPRKTDDLEFRRGYYCATANIISAHGDTVIAEDVLRAYGKVNFTGIDKYDVEKLKLIAQEMKRKAAYKHD